MMSKENLEKQKLELEIRQLRRPWVLKWEFWKVVIPSAAVILSLWVTFQSGILDFERSRLSLEKAELKKEISEFEERKQNLKSDIAEGDSTKNALEDRIAYYRNQEKTLLSKLEKLGQKVNLSDQEKAQIKADYEKKRIMYLDRLKKSYNSERSRLESLNQIKSQLRAKSEEVAVLKAELKFRMEHSSLSKAEQGNLEQLIRTVEIENYNKRIKESNDEIKRLESNMEKTKAKINNMSADELFIEFELLFLEDEWKEEKKEP